MMTELEIGTELSFYDSYLPSLDAGKYQITVRSNIEGGSGTNKIDTGDYFESPISQEFEVRAPQFSLQKTEVHAMYPPTDSSAKYGLVLPHVVLDKRGVPWERPLSNTYPDHPWMALLVLREGEIELDEDGQAQLIQSSVEDFLKPVEGIVKPEIDPVSVASDVLDSPCQSIQLDLDLFLRLAPSTEELPYLTHVRQVNRDYQAIANYKDHSWFSVIVGNRFLDAGESGCKYFLHLVSLEGFHHYLDGGETPQGDTLQLISLCNWSCVSEPEKGKSFAELVLNFVDQAEGDPQNLMLRRQVNPPQNPDSTTQLALERLQQGYVPVDHQLPTGESTFAWYRGPFTPVEPQPLPRASASDRYPSSDSAMIYDPNSGVFDQSYAAAWTLGRLLALNHGPFSQAVFRHRQQSFQTLGYIMNRMRENPNLLEGDLKQNLDRFRAVQGFRAMLKNQVDQKLIQTFTESKKASVQVDPQTVSACVPLPKSNPVTLLRQLLQNPKVITWMRQEIGSHDEEIISDWLSKKQLLYDIPFVHLVADEQCLPPESLRFFYIDQNWIDVLIDGAMSVGIHSSKDQALKSAVRSAIKEKLLQKASVDRQQMLKGARRLTGTASKRAVCGLLIRSAVVSGWPGLVVKGLVGEQPVELMRMDRLSDNVLLCLFETIPETVQLSEPNQGLRFGVSDAYSVVLRNLADPVGKPTHEEPPQYFPKTGSFKDYYREDQSSPPLNVLNIKSIVKDMETALREATGDPDLDLTPSGFAIQMVKAPERLSFNPITNSQD